MPDDPFLSVLALAMTAGSRAPAFGRYRAARTMLSQFPGGSDERKEMRAAKKRQRQARKRS